MKARGIFSEAYRNKENCTSWGQSAGCYWCKLTKLADKLTYPDLSCYSCQQKHDPRPMHVCMCISMFTGNTPGTQSS